MDLTIRYSFEKAYLELARCCLKTSIKAPPEAEVPVNAITPPNIVIAILAQTYIFSYMAIVAFVNRNLGDIWDADGSPLQAEYPAAKNIGHLLNSDLRELKDSMKVLCKHLRIAPIHETQDGLWNELLQVVRGARNFLVHPYPDPDALNEIIGGAVAKYKWGFPSSVAERVIAYFFEAQNLTVPAWVRGNEEFFIESIQALRINSIDSMKSSNGAG